MPAVSVAVDGHVGDLGLVMRRRDVMIDSHQVRVPYMSSRVVKAGGVVVTVEGERKSFGGWNGGLPIDMDVLRIMALNIKEDKMFY